MIPAGEARIAGNRLNVRPRDGQVRRPRHNVRLRLNKSCTRKYKNWLAEPGNGAFAVSSRGACSWTKGYSDPELAGRKALSACRGIAKFPDSNSCRVILVKEGGQSSTTVSTVQAVCLLERQALAQKARQVKISVPSGSRIILGQAIEIQWRSKAGLFSRPEKWAKISPKRMYASFYVDAPVDVEVSGKGFEVTTGVKAKDYKPEYYFPTIPRSTKVKRIAVGLSRTDGMLAGRIRITPRQTGSFNINWSVV